MTIPFVGNQGPLILGQLLNEEAFQRWYAQQAKKFKLDPDPDSPLHFYDWRAAYRAGATAEVSSADGEAHWPSTFKRLGHPNLIVKEGATLIDTRTMQPATLALINANDAEHKRIMEEMSRKRRKRRDR